ncbi:uncharacterized protein KD926_003159 [Aspergillus affinis]|uniref:uncharacterized protein n=1 Tax=Aspergillus affinis TaxID=1070780 RepID=UPI0022FE7B83|nr:uncharacterized protein KD926_003159 [Aspergillus affinis]KAI9035648.1 hypothetical protein KD926_003159 [Aspergillus affinis]
MGRHIANFLKGEEEADPTITEELERQLTRIYTEKEKEPDRKIPFSDLTMKQLASHMGVVPGNQDFDWQVLEKLIGTIARFLAMWEEHTDGSTLNETRCRSRLDLILIIFLDEVKQCRSIGSQDLKIQHETPLSGITPDKALGVSGYADYTLWFKNHDDAITHVIVIEAKKQSEFSRGIPQLLGYMSSHILSIMIERGYAVTATVRSQGNADDIIKTHPSWKDKIQFAIVADFTSTKPFDDLSKIQRPLLTITTEILKAAHHYGGAALKRFVLLGSEVSVHNSFEDMSREGKSYTEKDWSPVGTYCHSFSSLSSPSSQATRSQPNKLSSERTLCSDITYPRSVRKPQPGWEFIKQNTPSFDLVVINPDIIIGPMIHPISGPRSIIETNQFAIVSFIDGTYKQIEGVAFPFYHFVDVRDVARSHVDALKNS